MPEKISILSGLKENIVKNMEIARSYVHISITININTIASVTKNKIEYFISIYVECVVTGKGYIDRIRIPC